MDVTQAAICQPDYDHEKLMVVDACADQDGKTDPGRSVQACTELLDRKIVQGSDRYFVYANRALTYLNQGNKDRALEDLNEAIALAPHNANLLYDRALFYAAERNVDATLQDLDRAIHLDSRPALAFYLRGAAFRDLGDSSDSSARYQDRRGP